MALSVVLEISQLVEGEAMVTAELLEDILGPKFDDAAAVPRGAIEEAATGG